MIFGDDDTYKITYSYQVWTTWQETENMTVVYSESYSKEAKEGEEVYIPSLSTNGSYLFPLPGFPDEVLFCASGMVVEGGGNPDQLETIDDYPNGFLIPSMIAEPVDIVMNYGPLYDTVYCIDYYENDAGEYEATNQRQYQWSIGSPVKLAQKEVEGYTFNSELSNLEEFVELRYLGDEPYTLTRYYDKVKDDTPDPEEGEDPEPVDPDPTDPDDGGDEEEIIDDTDPEPEDPDTGDESGDVDDTEPEEVVDDEPTVDDKPDNSGNTEKAEDTDETKKQSQVNERTVSTESEPDPYSFEAAAQEIPNKNKESKEPTTSTINNGATPLTRSGFIQNWALLNLILMLGTVLCLLKLSKKKYNLAAIILPILSILVFILTENTFAPMVFVDKWTILMAIMYVVEVLLRWLGKKEYTEEEQIRL